MTLATGDVRFFKDDAPSGLSTDPIGDGWTQLTGTADTGQDATKRAVMDNGLFRVVLDKNKSGSAGSFYMYGFNGTSWAGICRSDSTFDEVTVTSVQKNTANELVLDVTFLDDDNVQWTGTFTMQRGIPGVRFDWQASSSLVSTHGKLRTLFDEGSIDPFFGMVFGDAYSLYGASIGAKTPGGIDHYACFAVPGLDMQILLATRKTSQSQLRLLEAANRWNIQNNGVSDSETGTLWFCSLPNWSFGLGDGGTPDVGNGADGQFREAEDNDTDVSGTWADKADSSCSNGESLSNSSPSVGHAVEWDINFPVAGKYYVAVHAVAGDTGYTMDVGIDGDETESGGAQTIPNTTFSSQEKNLLYGPFTIASAGDKTVRCTLDATGGSGSVDIDFLIVYPHEKTGSSPKTHIFPKDLANALLNQVTY